jgi:hypothetical protein
MRAYPIILLFDPLLIMVIKSPPGNDEQLM